MNEYIGHTSQLFGVEEHRLVGGKGDGLRLLEVTNGGGLEAVISLDRNGDISRLRFKGVNLGYVSPCGYAAPAYYEPAGDGWLKTFTAGFLTTCGLENVGTPCTDQGEVLGLECGNADPDGRSALREQGRLKFLKPGERKTYAVTIRMMEGD